MQSTSTVTVPPLSYCEETITSNAGDVVLPGPVVLPPPVLDELAVKSTGSATLVKRAVFADFILNIDKGEITDKGSINQRMIIQNHSETVERLYSASIGDDVLEISK